MFSFVRFSVALREALVIRIYYFLDQVVSELSESKEERSELEAYVIVRKIMKIVKIIKHVMQS